VRLAAIDVGTVTTRLFIADVSESGIAEVERCTGITHLGERIDSTGRLSEEALVREIEVLADYAERMRAAGVVRYAAIATSASRDAENGEEFLRRAEEQGIELEIVTGNREAELSFCGATSARSGEGMLVVDCGGGSTELILGDVTEEDGRRHTDVRVSRSIDVGSRRMTERFMHSDPPSRAELDEARSWAAAELRPFFDALDERPRQMVSVAGTATSLAAIELKLAEYDAEKVHGHVVSGSSLCDMLEMLAGLPRERRREVVGLHPGRAGVIVAGALILETTLALAGLDSMIVSEHDILWGILLDTYRSTRG
jgi:exopolyphosphatase/guanosine-5'-triphosphate,3'-diphosphate pyrophosphatase